MSSSPEISDDVDVYARPNANDDSDPPSPAASKKRKRDTAQDDELEIDVALPESPSKKALRKAKKQKGRTASTSMPNDQAQSPANAATTTPASDPPLATPTNTDTNSTSPHSIWIGNLPFNANKALLRAFFVTAAIPDDAITRIHMPLPTNTRPASKSQPKPQNKGFAYVDFSTPAALATALALSETQLGGRRVLIKAAKDFTGRPASTSATAAALAGVSPETQAAAQAEGAANAGLGSAGKVAKQPTRRVFVGNLGFDVTREELEKHFEVCGAVENVFMATFEDSGKCKGFAWVSFEDVDAAAAAVRGWTRVDGRGMKHDDEDGDGGVEERQANSDEITTKKSPKPRKWFVNRLQGRTLRCEFAEDPTTRYKKRFGKEKDGTVASGPKLPRPVREQQGAMVSGEQATVERTESSLDAPTDRRGLGINPGAPSDASKRRGRTDKAKRIHDETKYRTGAITQATGTRVSFD